MKPQGGPSPRARATVQITNRTENINLVDADTSPTNYGDTEVRLALAVIGILADTTSRPQA